MRAFAAYLLALGLVVSPAMAAAGPAGDKDKDNSTAAKTSSTAASDNTKAGSKDASDTASKPNPEAPGKTAASSTLEGEVQQLRELLENQSRQIQIQNEQMREQQERMEAMEAELKVATTPPDTSYVAAPDSRVPKNADGSTPAPKGFGGLGLGTSDGQAASPDNPVAIRFKGITLTPGGFLAAETVFRNKAMGADINTPFNNVPFSGNPGGQTTEWNSSARQSRLSLLAEGKLNSVTIGGYVETDFLGAGITSNDNESNSYVLRVRQAWGQAKWDSGFAITGGQMWSLVTETKKGTDNRTEALPMTIDPQYTVGFSWARQEALRVQKTFGDEVKFTLAASVEGSNTTLTVHGNPTTVLPSSSTITVTDGVTSVATPSSPAPLTTTSSSVPRAMAAVFTTRWGPMLSTRLQTSSSRRLLIRSSGTSKSSVWSAPSAIASIPASRLTGPSLCNSPVTARNHCRLQSSRPPSPAGSLAQPLPVPELTTIPAPVAASAPMAASPLPRRWISVSTSSVAMASGVTALLALPMRQHVRMAPWR